MIDDGRYLPSGREDGRFIAPALFLFGPVPPIVIGPS
jgi:hypothetical protein